MLNKNSHIFVAGHRGMVGSSIKRKLIENNFKNIITKSREELDLTNQNQVNNFFSKNSVDCVILAAAKVGGIASNIKLPAEFIYDNIVIQTNVIRTAKINEIKKIIFR